MISLHILVHRDPSQRAAQTISSVLLGLGLAALAGPLIRSLDRDADERERDEVALRQAAADADAEQQRLQKEVNVITSAATKSIEAGEALAHPVRQTGSTPIIGSVCLAWVWGAFYESVCFRI